MVLRRQDFPDCISEEVLGFGRKLPEVSRRGGESSPRSSSTYLWSRARKVADATERLCP